jgi:DNA invertase Pin-like site-specific DNA recombinase
MSDILHSGDTALDIEDCESMPQRTANLRIDYAQPHGLVPRCPRLPSIRPVIVRTGNPNTSFSPGRVRALQPPGSRRVWRQFDVIMAWSVDRLGRSLQDLVGFLSEIHALKIDLYLHQQGLDTTTPAGKAMFQMMGVFAELERAMIQERVRAGLARARDEGKTLGRPRIDLKLETAIRRSLAAGVGIGKTARTHSVGTATVQRIKAELTA